MAYAQKILRAAELFWEGMAAKLSNEEMSEMFKDDERLGSAHARLCVLMLVQNTTGDEEKFRRLVQADEGVREMYRGMALDHLKEIRAAFTADREDARVRGDQAAVWFCDHRLTCLGEEIARRHR